MKHLNYTLQLLENRLFVARFRHVDQSSKREVVDIPNVDWTEIREELVCPPMKLYVINLSLFSSYLQISNCP